MRQNVNSNSEWGFSFSSGRLLKKKKNKKFFERQLVREKWKQIFREEKRNFFDFLSLINFLDKMRIKWSPPGDNS